MRCQSTSTTRENRPYATSCPRRDARSPRGLSRRALFIAALALAAAAAPARADEARDKGAFGVGIIIGEPTGVSAKLYLKDDQAVQAAVGSDFFSGGLQVHAD